ncbi:MAG TPA: helicase-associated domain-containing protein [Ktedonobacterales bacterium]
MIEEPVRRRDDTVGSAAPTVSSTVSSTAATTWGADTGAYGLEAAAAFQLDLYRYWRVVATTGGFAMGRGQHVPRLALRRLREGMAPGAVDDEVTLAEPDDGRVFFMRRLLERLGLLRQEDDRRLVAADRAEMARYLALPFSERLRLAARLWVAGAWWMDHGRAAPHAPRLLAPAPPRIAVARRRAQQMLIDLAPGDALVLPPPATPLGGTVRRARPRAAARSGAVGSAEPGFDVGQGRVMVGGEGGAVPAGWDASDADVVRAALTGPLCWLGFVVPESAHEQLPAGASTSGPPGGTTARWRTTAAVAALRSEQGAGTPMEPVGRVVAQPNFEIVALPPLAAPTVLALDTCAEPRGVDRAARYALTRQSFAGACQAGWSPDTVAERLEAVIGGPLPQNVRTTIADWARRAERVRLRAGTAILEVRDAAVLDALLADPRAADWVERRATPTLALLRAAAVAPTRAWLLRHGIMAAMSTRHGELAAGAVKESAQEGTVGRA